jgi:hypothetical protein
MAAAKAAEVSEMAQINSDNRNNIGGVFHIIRRIFTISIPATMVASATAAILFAIALDGCSKHDKNTAVTTTSANIQAETTPAPVQPAPTPSAISPLTAKKPLVKRPTTVSFKDENYGISFRYPRKYKLLTPEKDNESVEKLASLPMNFAQPGGVNVAAVELTYGPALPFLKVSVAQGLSSEQCQMFALPEKETEAGDVGAQNNESVVQKVSIRGTEFSKVENVTDQLEARYYHHFEPVNDKNSGDCYEVVLGVSQSPDSTKQVDEAAMFKQLERILATVKIQPEIKVAETASVSAQPSKVAKPQ